MGGFSLLAARCYVTHYMSSSLINSLRPLVETGLCQQIVVGAIEVPLPATRCRRSPQRLGWWGDWDGRDNYELQGRRCATALSAALTALCPVGVIWSTQRGFLPSGLSS